jgi:glycosyltransferase involved in cell wall biosynthesis
VVWPFGPELEQSGIPLRVFRRRHSLEPRRVVDLARALRADRVDILLSFSQRVNLYAYLAILLARRGVFLASFRGVEPPEPPFERWIHARLYRKALGIVSNSNSGAAFTARNYRIPRERIRVIPNGIDPSRFADPENPAETRRSLGLPPLASVVGMVGRVTASKRVDVFLEAASIILARIPDCRFLVVGTGDRWEAMRDRSSEMGLDSKVIFTGDRDDVPAILSALDLLLLPSEFEALPNVVMEAMAAGKPVIASDLEGCRELVEEGVTGFLVPPGDSKALADRAVQVLSLSDRGRSLGARGRKRIASEFSLGTMVGRFEALFQEAARPMSKTS